MWKKLFAKVFAVTANVVMFSMQIHNYAKKKKQCKLTAITEVHIGSGTTVVDFGMLEIGAARGTIRSYSTSVQMTFNVQQCNF